MRERFAKVEINPSKPIVPFRETAVKAPGLLIRRNIEDLLIIGIDMAPPKTPGAKRGTIQGTITNNLVKFTIRAAPVPAAIAEFLRDNHATLKRMEQEQGSADRGAPARGDDGYDEEEDYDTQGEVARKPSIKPEEFWKGLLDVCQKAGGEWVDIVDKIWAFGPQKVGSCMLIDARPGGQPNS